MPLFSEAEAIPDALVAADTGIVPRSVANNTVLPVTARFEVVVLATMVILLVAIPSARMEVFSGVRVRVTPSSAISIVPVVVPTAACIVAVASADAASPVTVTVAIPEELVFPDVLERDAPAGEAPTSDQFTVVSVTSSPFESVTRTDITEVSSLSLRIDLTELLRLKVTIAELVN